MTAEPTPTRVLLLVRRLRGGPNGPIAREVLGACERAALAASLALRAELGAHVTAVAVGPANREDRVLAMALRAGCDHAVRIYDADIDGLDYLGIATILAGAARRLGFDLIVCGDRSEDECQGAVGPAVAELLGVPHASAVEDVRAGAGALIATRRGDGRLQTVRIDLPAVVGIGRFARKPEADEAAPRDRRATTEVAREELDLRALGLTPAELAYRRRFIGAAREVRSPKRVTLLPSAAALVSRLHDDRLLE